MNLAKLAIDKKIATYFATAVIIIGGFAAFFSLGQLEDPNYSVKTANIITLYPGASPEEVELEVTDRIEIAIQEMKQIKWVESFSRAGFSYVKVEMKPVYWSDKLPQIWDELRRKVREVETQLPPGAGRPAVNDDFGDVFGFQLAVVGDGVSNATLERYAKILRKELSVVEGVARADLLAVQEKIVYLDVTQSQLSELGLSDLSIERTLQQQNMVVDAGSVDLQERRYRIAPTGNFRSPSEIENLTIRPSILDVLQNPSRVETRGFGQELIRIGDIGKIRRGYRDPPTLIMRYNGMPAVGISITNRPGVNIVEVGQAIDARLAELTPYLPVGIEVRRYHWQSDIVDAAVNSFVVSFLEAVGIVLVVLTLFMGWRMGVIIGTGLVVTVLGTFIFMAVFEIDLQRMSLGALVIALGMMVDNSIVIADGIAVRLQKGMERTEAALEVAAQQSGPLLGATLIAVAAFYPIFSSPESTGEYCQTLFTVTAISLLFSWLVALTLTPVQCLDMLPAPKTGAAAGDPYGGRFYGMFRGFLERAIRGRFIFLACMVAVLAAGVVGFGGVRQEFFPASSMTKFMIDYRAPIGTRVTQVAADLRVLEERLLADERVDSVTAFAGGGSARFYLPVEPEEPLPHYGHLVVNVHDFREIDGLIEDLTPWLLETYPKALVPIRKYDVGPGKMWKFESRISGPAVADPDELRALADKALRMVWASPYTAYARQNWEERTQRLEVGYSQDRGRWSRVTRDDLARTTKRAFDGRQIGLYREGDDLIPIILRHREEERRNVSGIESLQIRPELATEPVPLAQVTEGVAPVWEDPIVRRRDRRRTVKIQANPVLGETLPTLMASGPQQAFEQMAQELPPGYRMEWGGLHEDTVNSQKALIPGIIPAVIVMLLVMVYLFNSLRIPLVIVLAIPFIVVGISAGLLAIDVPFGFMALLGAMSLSGMMIKNSIVLLDEVNLNLSLGKQPFDAVVEAAVSRLRPVALAAATTVLGVVPLLQDVFWISMATTIMAGLTFGTLVTMVLVPVLYSTLFRVKAPPVGAAPEPVPAPAE